MSPGRNPSRSPASTAGRDRMMRSTSLRSNSATACATASQVFPVPAGPVPNTSALRRSARLRRLISSKFCRALAGSKSNSEPCAIASRIAPSTSPETRSSPRLSRSYSPSSTRRACSQASREPSMVTWLPRESATTPSRRSISARFCPYWPNSTEASRLSSKASTTWVAALSPAVAGVGTSAPLSDPRVRNASGLHTCQRGRRDVRRRGEFTEQAVRAGARDRDGDHLADQRRRRHHLHGLQIGRAADKLAGQPASFLEQHVEGAADAARVEAGLVPVDLGLQPREPFDLDGLLDLIGAFRRRRAGTR